MLVSWGVGKLSSTTCNSCSLWTLSLKYLSLLLSIILFLSSGSIFSIATNQIKYLGRLLHQIAPRCRSASACRTTHICTHVIEDTLQSHSLFSLYFHHHILLCYSFAIACPIRNLAMPVLSRPQRPSVRQISNNEYSTAKRSQGTPCPTRPNALFVRYCYLNIAAEIMF